MEGVDRPLPVIRRSHRSLRDGRIVPYEMSVKLKRPIHRVDSRPMDKPPLDPALARGLRAEFEEDIGAVERVTGRHLDAWSAGSS